MEKVLKHWISERLNRLTDLATPESKREAKELRAAIWQKIKSLQSPKPRTMFVENPFDRERIKGLEQDVHRAKQETKKVQNDLHFQIGRIEAREDNAFGVGGFYCTAWLFSLFAKFFADIFDVQSAASMERAHAQYINLMKCIFGTAGYEGDSQASTAITERNYFRIKEATNTVICSLIDEITANNPKPS